MFEKNPELEEDVLEGVDEVVVPVVKVNVPVYTDAGPNVCAAGVVATTAAADMEVDVDVEALTEEEG